MSLNNTESKFVYYRNQVPGAQDPNRVRLHVYGELSEKNVNEIKKGDYDLLWLFLQDFDGLDNLPSWNPRLKQLRFQCADPVNIDWVSELYDLELLVLEGNLRGCVDFNSLKKLKVCLLDYCNATKEIINSKCKLRSLSLSKLKTPITEFNSEFCRNIKVFGITGGNLEKLEGIEKFKSLESLSLLDMRKLSDIQGIMRCEKLIKLDIAACNKIEDIAFVGGMSSIEQIVFENKHIASLSDFLPGKKIKFIRLGERTLINDKDISVCLKFPKLEKMSFYNKRNYSHTHQEINELLRKRGDCK